jgi:hypothetical protein
MPIPKENQHFENKIGFQPTAASVLKFVEETADAGLCVFRYL